MMKTNTESLNTAFAESILHQVNAMLAKMEELSEKMDSKDIFSTPYDAELILKFRKLRGTAEHLQFRLSQIRDLKREK